MPSIYSNITRHHKIKIYLYFKTNGIYPHYIHHPVSTAQMLVMFDICSLKKRRDVLDCIFIYKLLNNYIDSPDLISRIHFKIKTKNTRYHTMFLIRGSLRIPLNRMLQRLNCVTEDVDPFSLSLNSFKRKLL